MEIRLVTRKISKMALVTAIPGQFFSILNLFVCRDIMYSYLDVLNNRVLFMANAVWNDCNITNAKYLTESSQ